MSRITIDQRNYLVKRLHDSTIDKKHELQKRQKVEIEEAFKATLDELNLIHLFDNIRVHSAIVRDNLETLNEGLGNNHHFKQIGHFNYKDLDSWSSYYSKESTFDREFTRQKAKTTSGKRLEKVKGLERDMVDKVMFIGDESGLAEHLKHFQKELAKI